MTPNGWVFSCERNDFIPIKVINKSGIYFSRKLFRRWSEDNHLMTMTLMRLYLIEEMVQKFNTDEHGGCIRQLLCYDIEEGFRAENVITWPAFTTFRF